MPVIDHLFSIGIVRKAIWKLWYPFVTRRLQKEEVLFLNYAFEPAIPLGLPLTAYDEPNRTSIQLYHQVATQQVIQGKNVLEVSCGHGGGASYLSRTLQPAQYIGLDLNATGIEFCRKRHQVPGLSFIQGDAENLPFAADSFDAVINVEASHCYPHFPKFLTEVARVLKPGGHFLYTDFRFSGGLAEWEQDLVSAPLKMIAQRVINPDVLRGMDVNSQRSLQLITKNLPKFLHNLGRDFAGVQGSRIYDALKNGHVSYRTYCFTKV